MLKLNVVVGGNPHLMELADGAPVDHLVRRALHETGHVAPALSSEWELRNMDGVILAALTQVADGATLFLSPKAGVGGNLMSERFKLRSGNQISLSCGPRDGAGHLTRLSIDYPAPRPPLRRVREELLSPEEAARIGRSLLTRGRRAEVRSVVKKSRGPAEG